MAPSKFVLVLLLFMFFSLIKSQNSSRKNVKLTMKQGLVMNQVLAFYGIDKTDNLQCKQDMDEFKNGLRAFEPWALQMFDSSSKLPSSILGGNLMEFGGYDQCLHIKHMGFVGKHCLVKLTPQLDLIKRVVYFKKLTEGAWNTIEMIVEDAALYLAVCIPSTCNHSDVAYHFNKTISDITVGLNLTISVDEGLCTTVEDYPRIGMEQYLTLAILGTFVVCVIFATTLHVIQQNEKNNFVDVFSFKKNFQRIVADGANDFGCLHGLRALSTCYVVMGHRYLFAVFFPLQNTLDIIDWTKSITSTFIIAGGVSVDTFFFLSGLLVSYGFFKHVTETSKFNLFVFYLRRYIRITFPFAIVILFNATMLDFFGSGPLYLQSIKALKLPCRYFWWSAMLHVQPYINPGFQCIVQTWYLSCEMIYYFLSPLILIPMWKSPKTAGYPMLIFSFLLSVAINFYIAWIGEYEAIFPITNKSLDSDYFKFHYVVPHTRAAPYILGLAFGYLLHRLKGEKLKTGFVFNLFIWIISAVMMLGSIMGVFFFLTDSHVYNKLNASLFLSLSRSAWTLGLAWIVWTCINGQGGVINYFFSMYGFKVLGRISYGIFLCHICFQFVKHSGEKIPLYFSNFHAIHEGLGDVTFMIFVGFFFTIFYELPLIRFENLIFRALSKKSLNKVDVTN